MRSGAIEANSGGERYLPSREPEPSNTCYPAFVRVLGPIWSHILAIFENIDPILDKNTERIRKKNIDSTRREKRIKAKQLP